LAEGILLRSGSIQPSSVSKGASLESRSTYSGPGEGEDGRRGAEEEGKEGDYPPRDDPPPRRPPAAAVAPPCATELRRNLEANFFSVSRNVVLARSLFIASPPPPRSSISDANSCKLPSSRLLAFLLVAILRGLDRAPSTSPPPRVRLDPRRRLSIASG